MPQQLFLLGYDDDETSGRVYPAVDQQGKVWCDLVEAGINPAEGVLRAAMYQHGELQDLLFTAAPQLTFSERLYAAMLELDGDMNHLASKQVDITNKRGDTVAKYWAVHAKHDFDVVDYEQAEFHYFVPPPPNLIRRVKAWVVREECVPHSHVFREKYGDWMASPRFVELCAARRFTGLSFAQVKVV